MQRGGGNINIVICGGRDFGNYEQAKKILDKYIGESFGKIKIISGGCRGADKIGERYAQERGLEIIVFKAEWDKYGKAAGPKRNEEMAWIADLIICFWDGKSRGTRSMIEFAKKYQKRIIINKY